MKNTATIDGVTITREQATKALEEMNQLAPYTVDTGSFPSLVLPLLGGDGGVKQVTLQRRARTPYDAIFISTPRGYSWRLGRIDHAAQTLYLAKDGDPDRPKGEL